MTTQLLTFTGQDACIVGLAANRQPEVMIGDPPVWRASYGMPQASRIARTDPQCVRLVASARILAEDILRRDINVDEALPPLIETALANDTNITWRAALQLIRSKVS